MLIERLLLQDDNYMKNSYIFMCITGFALHRSSPSEQSICWQVVRNGEKCDQHRRNGTGYHPHIMLLSLIEQNTSNVLIFFPINNIKQNI